VRRKCRHCWEHPSLPPFLLDIEWRKEGTHGLNTGTLDCFHHSFLGAGACCAACSFPVLKNPLRSSILQERVASSHIGSRASRWRFLFSFFSLSRSSPHKKCKIVTNLESFKGDSARKSRKILTGLSLHWTHPRILKEQPIGHLIIFT